MAKIVDRHKDEWNTHIFLESVCKEFDPNTGYANMVRRDMVRMHSFPVKPTPSHQPTLAASGLGMGECTIRRLFCKLWDNTIHCDIYFFFPTVPFANINYGIWSNCKPRFKTILIFRCRVKFNATDEWIHHHALTVRVRVGDHLNAAYSRRMNFEFPQSNQFFSSHKN